MFGRPHEVTLHLSDMKLPGIFGPSEVSILSAVFDAAMGEISEGGRADALPARDLRRLVATGIIAAAQTGARDPEELKRAGLAAVAGRGS